MTPRGNQGSLARAGRELAARTAQEEGIAAKLRLVYGAYLSEPVPPELEALIRRMSEGEQSERSDDHDEN